MDPLHLTIAFSPLAMYCLVLGLVNLAPRPLMTTGSRDTAALGLGLSGLAMAGPVELFLPESAAVHLGWLVWVLMAVFYALCLALLILLLRPRLVIYNSSMDQLRPLLADVVAELDRDARWAGDSLVLPRLGIQLHVSSFPAMRNVQLVSLGLHQSHEGWKRFENALLEALRQTQGARNRYGISLLFFGLVMVGIVTFSVVNNTQAVALQLQELLRL